MKQAGKRMLCVLLSLCVAMVCVASMATTANADDVIHVDAVYQIGDLINSGEGVYVRHNDRLATPFNIYSGR
jgi:hypothetical protein